MSRPFRRSAWSGLLVVLFATSSEAATRHVLLLQSLNRGNLTLDCFTASFLVELERRSPEPVTFTQFVVNPAGLETSPKKAFVDFLRSAFADRPKPDLVMTAGGPAAAFARQYREQLFPESPLLVASVDRRFLEGAPLGANETAVAVDNDFSQIIDDILQLFPRTANVFMVMDSGPIGRFWHQELERDFRRFGDRVAFIWPDELSRDQLLQRVSALPPQSAIFFLTFGTDARGGTYPEDRVLAEIHAAADAPLFATQSALMGHGIVGGRLMPIDEVARTSADVALRLLNGESPGGIRVPLLKAGPPVFDGRELKRWNVSESRLPPGSVVLFREPGAWQRFKWIILASASVLLAQAALIGTLLVSRVKRRRAEQALRQNVTDLNTARTALSSLSRRLMEAQEQERTRLARELHDDVGQRMSFVAMDLARVHAGLPDEAGNARAEVGHLYEALLALARDVQGISHRLHTSKVQYLGLSAAARSFCGELSTRHALKIEYIEENVPPALTEATAINLFRMLQEALSNAVKHSGAQACKVALRGGENELLLEVIDDGRGFDIRAALKAHGLGLVSMQERLRLIDGELVVESKVGSGTAVRARVPLRAQTVDTEGSRSN